MNNDEIKILSNMSFILPLVESKNIYSEDDYSNIYKLIDGYKKIQKYFHNNSIIDSMLDKEYGSIRLFDLIRIVRNRSSHVDKNNNIDKYIVLQTKVPKIEIDNMISEIKKEMNIIYGRDLNSDAYKFIMNSKIMIYIFELSKAKINDEDYRNDFDKYSREALKPIINEFNYQESTLKDYEEYVNQILKIYKSDIFKNEIIKIYGANIYNDIIRMIADENFTCDEIRSLVDEIKNIDNSQ